VFSTCLPKSPASEVMDTSVTEGESSRSRGLSSHPSISSDAPQATASPAAATPEHQRQQSDPPALVAESNCGKDQLITDESSFEELQMDVDFIQKQHAILDQIRVEGSQSYASLRGEKRSSPSSPLSNASPGSTRPFGYQDTSSLKPRAKMDLHESQESSDDFLQYLNDPNVLEEQRRIMENILNGSPDSFTRHTDPRSREYRSSLYASSMHSNGQDRAYSSSLSTSAHSNSTRHVNDEILGFMEEAATCVSLPPPRREQRPPFQYTRSASEPNVLASLSRMPMPHSRASSATLPERRVDEKDANSHTTRCEHDALFELYQGKKIQVRGTNHTWKSIAKGNATLVQCPVCFTILQVGSTAKLLFCTKCNEVSPILSDVSASLDYRADGLIAVVVQQQEVDVAFAKKMARNASNK